MKRNPLRNWLPFVFASIIAPLVAAWPQRAQAGNWVFDNAGTAIPDNTTTTVNWTTANVWNPDGNNPGGAADSVWANAILTSTGLPASITAGTVLNLNLAETSRGINSFQQIGQNATNPNNITTNITGDGALPLP